MTTEEIRLLLAILEELREIRKGLPQPPPVQTTEEMRIKESEQA